ncbi:flagellar protein FlgJ [Povalibacter uvarum]|uniref:Peptidoglycan hydrolase FlgJ n=1 Tax=Povalibacter uvarum TaxID=732238 RepID=A0A841HN71_9GAMM|nr:flagellar assembly peptidoglycan hydrolase FlgJ [Povalibacter uvarum]MBB6094203.1 flagellar protein FlgJ [Povalibacter uvarum]
MTSAPTNVSFFADPKALSSLKSDARAQDPGALKEVAKQFESLFTQMLLKSMREANRSLSNGDTLFGSDQADFYQDMFDQQIAVHLSKGEGLGLADMLVRQLAGGAASGEQRAVSQKTESAGSNGATEAAGPSPVATSKADFIRRMLPHAQEAARELGVDPQALLAQAALETGWGKSVPCNAAGDCSYNLFGIKAGSSWSGATVNVPTLEFEDGVAVRKVDRFRAYESPADSFKDYARLIRNNPRYEAALNAGTDVAGFASALQQGGYATDPNYANKITAVAREVQSMTGLKFDRTRPISTGGEA